MIRAYSIVAVLIVIAAIGWSHRSPRHSTKEWGGIQHAQGIHEIRVTENTTRYSNVRYWLENILPVSGVVLAAGTLLAYFCQMLESHTGFYRGYR